MSNVLLAAFGTGITLIAFAGFSVYQLEKTAAEAHGPRRHTAADPDGSSPEATDRPPRAA